MLKRNKHKCNFHFPAMLMMTSQILKSADFTETQKSWYLENKTRFFLQIKKFIKYTSRATLYNKEQFYSAGNLECGTGQNH